METLNYTFEHGRLRLPVPAQVVGVVGSGNLEVLIEAAALGGACHIEINTAAIGFGATWEAVMSDFQQRWRLADVRIAINDMGATPAVVSLRLDQAVQTMLDDATGAPATGAPAAGIPVAGIPVASVPAAAPASKDAP